MNKHLVSPHEQQTFAVEFELRKDFMLFQSPALRPYIVGVLFFIYLLKKV